MPPTVTGVDLTTFESKFQALRQLGYIESTRSGDTGIGHTLESSLGLTENNISMPDLVEAELKSHRRGSSSLVTLFTRDRDAWLLPQGDAIERYGTTDDGDRINLYATLSSSGLSGGLTVHATATAADVVDAEGLVLARWSYGDLAVAFAQKFPALVLVTADTRMTMNGVEEFHFSSAEVLTQTDPSFLEEGLRAGWVLIDLRLHKNQRSGIVRNHGTGFRVAVPDLPKLFGCCRVL